MRWALRMSCGVGRCGRGRARVLFCVCAAHCHHHGAWQMLGAMGKEWWELFLADSCCEDAAQGWHKSVYTRW